MKTGCLNKGPVEPDPFAPGGFLYNARRKAGRFVLLILVLKRLNAPKAHPIGAGSVNGRMEAHPDYQAGEQEGDCEKKAFQESR